MGNGGKVAREISEELKLQIASYPTTAAAPDFWTAG
jgi:hypothetical protein